MSRFINPVPQFFLNDGSLASSGRMKFFANEDYSTLKDTFSQPDNTVPNTNPVKLDGSGRMPPTFGEGLYSVKFYAYDPNEPDGLGALQWTRDNVSLSTLTGQFDVWSPIESYDQGDSAKASDGDYYQSLSNGNKGNNPISSPSFWTKIIFITEYNANVNYAVGKTVSRLGRLYSSNVFPNIGNTPPAAQWDNLSFNNTVTGDLTVTGDIDAVNMAKTAVKITTTLRNSTTTLAADPELTISGLALATWYKVTCYVCWNGNGSTANGLAARLNTTDGLMYSAFYLSNTNVAAGNSDPTANVSGGIPGGFNKLPNYAGASDRLIIEAVILTNGSGSPAVFLEWAQSVSNATNTRVTESSYISVSKL